LCVSCCIDQIGEKRLAQRILVLLNRQVLLGVKAIDLIQGTFHVISELLCGLRIRHGGNCLEQLFGNTPQFRMANAFRYDGKRVASLIGKPSLFRQKLDTFWFKKLRIGVFSFIFSQLF